MPQAKPKDRPGTRLQGVDLLCAKEATPPDRTGRDWGMVWAAWRQYPADANRVGKIKVYVMRDDTGDLVKGKERVGYGRHGRTRARDHHTVETWEQLDERIWRLYWTQLRTEETPLADLQNYLRQKMSEQAAEEHYQQRRDIWRSTWSVSSRFDDRIGGTVHYVQ